MLFADLYVHSFNHFVLLVCHVCSCHMYADSMCLVRCCTPMYPSIRTVHSYSQMHKLTHTDIYTYTYRPARTLTQTHMCLYWHADTKPRVRHSVWSKKSESRSRYVHSTLFYTHTHTHTHTSRPRMLHKYTQIN